jgi:hypothetical protein
MKNINRVIARVCVAATAGGFLTSIIASAAAADTVRWQTIIGIQQAGNIVGNITGGGQPWTTTNGRAKVDLSRGRVDFEVDGLVLAGGNTIGTPGAINQVMGTLLCDPGGANVSINTPLVTLSPQGDAEFSGSVPPIPTTCTSSNTVFLILIPQGRWIANGSVRTSK